VAWRSPSPDGVLTMTMPGGGEWTSDAHTVFADLSRLDPKRWRDNQSPIIGNFKATPLMVGGTLYFNTPLSIGAAVDARTGRTKWVYNPRSYEAGTTTMSLRWNQRGVAYWRDGAGTEERICRETGDGHLIAVDAKTGRPLPGFGDNGRVDLMSGLPRAKRGQRDYLNALTYSVRSPPIVVRWAFHTVPQPGEPGHDTWQDGSWEHAGRGRRLDDDERGRGVGLRLPPDQHHRAGLLRPPPPG
jgi:hypothetical protein